MKLNKRELKKLIKQLEKVRGRHTELVSVYVPAGYDIVKIYQHLGEEQGTAKNIKDAKTRGNVISSLDKAIRMLKEMGRTPQNGLAVFSGNVSQQDNKIDIQAWAVEPPDPLNIRMYRCDQRFVLDPLRDMMEHKEVYGLIVMDRREATLGLLKGTRIDVRSHMTSGVPGKFKAGGQCLHPSTLVMLDSGEITPLEKIHNPHFVVSENFNQELVEPTPVLAKWKNNKKLYKITTCYPRVTLESSGDHTFFVRTENGIEELPLSAIKEGDYLLMPEKITLNLEDQPLNFSPFIKRNFQMKKIPLPKIITPEIAQFFGYYLGDGNYECDRITFSEQREEIALAYQTLIKKTFYLPARIRWRDTKHYFELRVGSRILSQLCRYYFPEQNKTYEGLIPPLILCSSDEILAAFLRGYFDAEGYVKGRVAFGISNLRLAQQVQIALLRLGIIASIDFYDNRKNPYSDKPRHIIAIDDRVSLQHFQQFINFTASDKREKLETLIKKRSNRNKVRQIVVNGKEIHRIIRNAGLKTSHFHASSFFSNKRQMSKEIFKRCILDKIHEPLLKKRLATFYLSNLIAIKIKSIEPLKIQPTVDIETKNHNFIANGLIVHNSSQRFERLIEGMALEFYKKIAERAQEEFLPMGNAMKGILVGGPGPTKESFVKELNNELRKKIIAVKDLTYTDESGLHDLVELSHENIAGEIVIEEKKIMTKFFETLAKSPSKASYGKKDVMEKIKMGAADIVLISDEMEDEIIEEFEEAAGQYGTSVRLISINTREGKQLFDLGGFAAILRYNVGE